VNSRRLDVSDYDLGEGVVPTCLQRPGAVTYGAASTVTTAFPVTQKERVAVGNLDLYAMDTYKLSRRWTVIAGLRATWNTNPVNQHDLLRARGIVLDMGHDAAQPLSHAIQTNVRSLFPGTPLFSWQPRASVAYKLSNTMALHAGAASSTTSFRRRWRTSAPQIPRMPGFRRRN